MRHVIALALSLVLTAPAFAMEATAIKPVTLPTVGMDGNNNGTWDMAAQKNAVFVFEAFANFCGYCNQNAPLVDSMAIQWKPIPRVQVIDLGIDRSPREYAQWMARHKPNHLVLNDGGRALFRQLTSSTSIPQTFVVDCKGVVHESTLGAWDQATITTLNAAIKEALEVTCE